MSMDSDIMPLCNLDNLYLLSYEGIFEENMVIAWWNEPATSGRLMLSPRKGN